MESAIGILHPPVDRIAVEPVEGGNGLGVPVGEGGSQAHTGKQKQGLNTHRSIDR